MATFDRRRGTVTGTGELTQVGASSTTTVRRSIEFSGISGAGVAANDIVQAIQLPSDCVVHWVGAEVTTANTSAASVQLSGAGYIYAVAANGNLSTAGQLAVSAATFPFLNSAASAIELVLTSGTMTAGNAVVRVCAVYTIIGE